VGTGPGNPDLLTLRAVRAIEDAHAIIAPMGMVNGRSSALETIRGAVDISRKEVVEIHFSMKKVRLSREKDKEVALSWEKAAKAVLERTDKGVNVVFPTLGDPSFYSTAYYLLATVLEKQPGLATEIIPGINAMSTCSSVIQSPLALGDDIFCVIPATFDDDRIEAALETFDSIALMKVHRCLPRIVKILDGLKLVERAVLVERCSLEGQRIFYDLRDAIDKKIHYFSTVLVRKQGMQNLFDKV